MLNLVIGAACYLLTSRGAIMPATYTGDAESGFPQVLSPNGKTYTCRPENVLEPEVGAVMLMHRRAEELAAQGYLIAVRNDGTFRVYCPKKHGVRGGYIVRPSGFGGHVCNCPAHEKHETCKHVMAVCSLLRNKAAGSEARGWKSGATRYENLATAIAAQIDAPAAPTTLEARFAKAGLRPDLDF